MCNHSMLPRHQMVAAGGNKGLEPPTSLLIKAVRSNHLSYKPHIKQS